MPEDRTALKAQVVAEWKAGSSAASLAKRYGVALSTVQRWHAGETRALPEVLKTNGLAAYDLDEMALRLIDGSVSTLGAIHRIGQREDWLQKQNASDLAILYGVIADKLIRVLAAIPKPERSALEGADREGEA